MLNNPILEDLINRIEGDLTGGALSTSIAVAESFIRLLSSTEPKRIRDSIYNFAIEVMSHSPTMASVMNFFNGVARILECERNTKERLKSFAEQFIGVSRSSAAASAFIAQILISNNDRIFLYSCSETVLETLNKAVEDGKHVEVISAQSYITGEGNEVIDFLESKGIGYKLIPEIALAIGIQNSYKVLVGADSITSDGFLVNKLGTYLVALVSREMKIPFIVISSTTKFNPINEAMLKHIDIRLSDRNRSIVPVPMFDRTPLHLVTKLVTEKGVMNSDEISSALKKNRSTQLFKIWWEKSREGVAHGK